MRGSTWLGALCLSTIAAIACGEEDSDAFDDGDETRGGRGGYSGSSGGKPTGKGGCFSISAGSGGKMGCASPPAGGEGGTDAAGAAGRGGSSGEGGGAGDVGVAGGGSGGEGGFPGSAGGQGGVDGSSGAPDSGGAAGTSGSEGGAGGDEGVDEVFALTSPSHDDGAEFADDYTCAAAGFSASTLPELSWTAGPEGTLSYAITFVNVTVAESQPQSDLAYQWVIYNIPAATLGLPEGFTNAASLGATQISASAGNTYLGPCPMGQESEYEFVVYALPTATLSVNGIGTNGVKKAKNAIEAAEPLAVATLTGTSDASPP